MLSTYQIILLILTILLGRSCHYPHFADEDTEAQRSYTLCGTRISLNQSALSSAKFLATMLCCPPYFIRSKCLMNEWVNTTALSLKDEGIRQRRSLGVPLNCPERASVEPELWGLNEQENWSRANRKIAGYSHLFKKLTLKTSSTCQALG